MSDPELKIPGNAGLKDQCMALKWVKANCADFGGDPDNISTYHSTHRTESYQPTREHQYLYFFMFLFLSKAIFGESAGGASVHFHMVSEMSNGLFHKAIAMSGTVYSPWAVSSVKDWTQRLSRKLGWNGDGGDKACLAILQNASADSITKAQESILTLEVSGSFDAIIL